MWRIRTDDTLCLDLDVVARLFSIARALRRGFDRLGPGAKRIVLVLDVVEVEYALLAGDGHRRVEELVGAVGKIHHDSIGPLCVLVGRLANVGGDSRDRIRDAVGLGVGLEILDRDGVLVDADGGRIALCRGDDEGANASEHVENLLAGVDLLGNAVALGREPGREEHRREVHGVRAAVLSVDGLRRLAVEDLPLAHAEFAFDLRGAVENRLDGNVGGDDRVSERSRPIGVVLVDDDDVADAFVARVELEAVRWHRLRLAIARLVIDDVEVGRHGVGIDDRHEDILALYGDPAIAIEEVRVLQLLAHGLTVGARRADTGRLHVTVSDPAFGKADVPTRRTDPRIGAATWSPPTPGDMPPGPVVSRMDLGLDGNAALVTASTSGLGLASARALAREGANVAICGRTKSDLDEAKATVEADGGGDVMARQADITDPDDVEDLVETTAEAYDGIDHVVTSAGGVPSGAFLDTDDRDWYRAYDMLVMSHVWTLRAAHQHLTESDAGSVVSITSTSVSEAIDGLVLSNAVRRAVVGTIDTIAREWAPDVRANVVMPGAHETPRIEELIEQALDRGEYDSYEAGLEDWAAPIPLGRIGDPMELGDVVAFLSSERASFVTGATLPIDGGRTRS